MEKHETHIELAFGSVRKKNINTPNHFISHMIEHIAWRMGLEIDLLWPNENWEELGRALGTKIGTFLTLAKDGASALGMIDDGSAAVAVNPANSGVILTSKGGVDLEWFLKLRCEQLRSGDPLIKLLNGLSKGLGAQIVIQVWSLEDPHHTWEGIFRGIGSALSRIYTPRPKHKLCRTSKDESCAPKSTPPLSPIAPCSGLEVIDVSKDMAHIQRVTAETRIDLSLNFSSSNNIQVQVEVDKSIRAAIINIEELFRILMKPLGASLRVSFIAQELSSSHVVFEDIGMVLGRALKEVLVLRMNEDGVNGAGSNLKTTTDLETKNVQVGVSVEGRKFWRFIPEDGYTDELRKSFLVALDVIGGLRSEDLDDLIDGLAGGLSASIIFHLNDNQSPDKLWREVFEGLGDALKEAFEFNPFRRGVTSGVKATLA